MALPTRLSLCVSLFLSLVLAINLPLPNQNFTSGASSSGAGRSHDSSGAGPSHGGGGGGGGGGTPPHSDPSDEHSILCVDPSQYPAWGVRSQRDQSLQWDDCRAAWSHMQMRLFPQNQQQRGMLWTFWNQEPRPTARFAMRTPVDEIYGTQC